MTQHAAARILPQASPTVGRGFREQIDATSHAVVAADQADILDAIGSVAWERRGLLRTLTRLPLPAPPTRQPLDLVSGAGLSPPR